MNGNLELLLFKLSAVTVIQVAAETFSLFLGQLSKKHHKGRMLKVDWLDRLTFREIEMVNEVMFGASYLRLTLSLLTVQNFKLGKIIEK